MLADSEQSFFASNVLLILVHACSRTSTAITLWRACQSTSSANFAIAMFPAVVLWTLGSILGLVIRRANNDTFWRPVGVDCDVSRQTHFRGGEIADSDTKFTLWMAVSLIGLAIDTSIAACAITVVGPLQIGYLKKLYTLFVFAAGIL